MRIKSQHRGFTLIELMIAMLVMLAATLAATQLMITGVSLTRNAENLAEDLDNARMAGSILAKDIQAAGLFTPKGVYVYGGPTAPTLINPVWAVDHASRGTDELYIVVPNKDAMREACSTPGAGVPVTAVAGGKPTINCTFASAPFSAGDVLVVSNLLTGALLFNTTFASASAGTQTAISADNLPGFSDTGSGGIGFQVTDVVYRADVWKYFIKLPTSTTRSGLYKRKQVPTTTAAVFTDDTTTGDVLVQDLIEDLQVKFIEDTTHQGNPSTYSSMDGYPVGYTGNARAVRVTVVAVGRRSNVNSAGERSALLGAPVVVENHDPSGDLPPGVADGYRRTLFTQELELTNLAPENL